MEKSRTLFARKVVSALTAGCMAATLMAAPAAYADDGVVTAAATRAATPAPETVASTDGSVTTIQDKIDAGISYITNTTVDPDDDDYGKFSLLSLY